MAKLIYHKYCDKSNVKSPNHSLAPSAINPAGCDNTGLGAYSRPAGIPQHGLDLSIAPTVSQCAVGEICLGTEKWDPAIYFQDNAKNIVKIAATSTESQRGQIEIATAKETNDGVDDVRAVTPLKLAEFNGIFTNPIRFAGGKMNFDGDVTICGSLDVFGYTHLHDTLEVDKDSTLHGNLQVDLNTNIDGTLDVTKATHLHHTLEVDKDSTLHGNLQVDKNTNIDGTLDVTKATHLKSTLEVNRDSTLHGNLQVDGNATVDQTLKACGVTYPCAPGPQWAIPVLIGNKLEWKTTNDLVKTGRIGGNAGTVAAGYDMKTGGGTICGSGTLTGYRVYQLEWHGWVHLGFKNWIIRTGVRWRWSKGGGDWHFTENAGRRSLTLYQPPIGGSRTVGNTKYTTVNNDSDPDVQVKIIDTDPKSKNTNGGGGFSESVGAGGGTVSQGDHTHSVDINHAHKLEVTYNQGPHQYGINWIQPTAGSMFIQTADPTNVLTLELVAGLAAEPNKPAGPDSDVHVQISCGYTAWR